MALSKEVRIGALVGISVFLLIFGIYFLKGSNIFSSDNTYYLYYDNVDGLVPSSAVQIKGMVIGRVKDVQFQGTEKVKVSITINHKVQLPSGTSGILFSPDLLGGKAIKLNLGSGPSILSNGDSIIAVVESAMLQKLANDVAPVMDNVKHAVSTLDSTLTKVNQLLDQQTSDNLHNSIASLNTTMKNFASLSDKLNKESGQLTSMIRNLNSVTGNIASNNDNITQTINNLKGITHKLSDAPLDETVKSLQSTVNELNTVLAKINRGEGSIGMAMNDKQLYQNLSASLASLDKLLTDLKKHPSRYINIRLFGKAPKDNQ